MHHYLLDVGVYFGPSGYEVGFVSSAHTDAQLDHAVTQIKAALAAFYQK
jgi:glutamate-1-semialdehyde 2,1-aminomutase